MPTLNNLPDLARSLKKVKFSIELENVPENTILGFAIKNGLRRKEINGVMQLIVDSAKDNRSIVEDLVGVELLKEIEAVCSPDPNDIADLF
jgi:hypothetical protein